MGEKTD